MIRELEKSELAIVQELAHKIWPSTFGKILSKEQINYMLDWMYKLETLVQQKEEGHRFFCYENEQGIPIAFLAVAKDLESNRLKIHKLYVLPEKQVKGVGKALLFKAFEFAKAQGMSTIYLNVNRHNKAVGFYQKMGMKITREEDISIGNGYLMEDYVFEIELTKDTNGVNG